MLRLQSGMCETQKLLENMWNLFVFSMISEIEQLKKIVWAFLMQIVFSISYIKIKFLQSQKICSNYM